ncbi:ATP-binding cassette domain-containing protein, partial [Streptomyces sp. SID5926]|nr:ATP-binding cassette domain-containing protein [Streptomyces sp. SID5926]
MRSVKLPRLVPPRPVPPPPAAPGDVLAAAEGLRVRLGGRPVLDGVDVEVRAGEVLALVGPNGAGKSTLLGALAADVPAAEGSVRVHGRPVSDWSA